MYNNILSYLHQEIGMKYKIKTSLRFALIAIFLLSAIAPTASPALAANASAGVNSRPKQAGSMLAVSAGDYNTCVIQSDSTLTCWGWNDDGQSVPPGGAFTQVSAGGHLSCGLRSDTTLACWGDIPTPPTGTFIDVSAGYFHACGVKTNATLACWGLNDAGQATPPGGTFTQVSAGGYHTCGLKSDSTLACWGLNTNGQSTPPGGTFTQISAGGSHTCGLRTNNTLACWGLNTYGQSTPPVGTFTQVNAGGYHTCGLLQGSGALTCWGDNSSGQVNPFSISGNAGAAGVILSYTDGVPRTVTADNSGNYLLEPTYGWSGTVTPSKGGAIFTPPQRTYSNVIANQTAQDYTIIGYRIYLPLVMR